MRTKNIVWPGLVLILVSAFISGGCRKENLGSGLGVSDSTASFSAVVDGVAWSTDSVSGYLSYEYVSKARVMTITGYGKKRLISISLKDTALSAVGSNDSTLAVQSYAVGGWGNAAAFQYGYNMMVYGPNVVWQQEGNAVSGSVAVSAADGVKKLISGTFEFSAKAWSVDSVGTVSAGTMQVSSGVFKNVHYTYFRKP